MHSLDDLHERLPDATLAILSSLRDSYGNRELWIETLNGHRWYFLDAPATLDQYASAGELIREISILLTREGRFGNHTRFHWSVASHSMLCYLGLTLQYNKLSLDLENEFAAAVLLHDAAEAYCRDIMSPLKTACSSSYSAIEDYAQAAIYDYLDIYVTIEQEEQIKRIDCACLKAEVAALMTSGGKDWRYRYNNDVAPPLNPKKLGYPIVPLNPIEVQSNFYSEISKYI